MRQGKNGQYFLSATPHNPTHVVTEAQAQQREKFRQAILYAKCAQATPEYKDAAKVRGQSAFNVPVADFLHPPEIQHIDLNEPTTITAVDDVTI